MEHDVMTQIFLDSGNPQDTQKALELLGSLDGQTTNPSLIAKSPKIQDAQKDLQEEGLLLLYKEIVSEIRNILGPKKSISIEVYADSETTSEKMIEQASVMNEWISDVHIKLPITEAGLKTANYLVNKGFNVNMTLCFSQEQALAVHYATLGAQPGQVFISPFIGRLDDIGQQGTDLIKNILFQYESIESHVSVLAASIRSVDHLAFVINHGCDIATVPLKVISDWSSRDFTLEYHLPENLAPISYQDIELNKNWSEYIIYHELTEQGLLKFSEDWKSIFNQVHES